MQIVPMRDLKNTVEIERKCAEENGPRRERPCLCDKERIRPPCCDGY